jgi:hypothetical protein
MLLHLFEAFIWGHIVFGTVGLVSFWVPVIGRKGGERHRLWGKIFAICLLVTGCFAIGMSLCTLTDPLGTHPKLTDAAFVRAIFGVMMLYLAILTVNLAWYGFEAVRNKRDHGKNRGTLNVALQPILVVAAAACAFVGWQSGQSLMIGMSIIGFATAGTNLMFMYNPRPGPKDWLKEHIKALVGAGISVYTAFFAFGAVRLMPEIALQPALWSVPLVVGLSIIIYHQFRIRQSLAGAGRGRGVMMQRDQPVR